MNARSQVLLAGLGLLLAAPVSVLAQPSVRDEIARARQLSSAGSFVAAESAYLAIVTAFPDAPRDLRGTAYFGRAFAAQQLLNEGGGTPIDTILSYYATAKDLSQRSTRVAADNNSGLALQSVGRHSEATRYFAAAASEVGGAERAQYLVNEGRAHEAADDPVAAARRYERALDADTTASEALRGLLRVMIRSAPSNLVLDKMDRWKSDSINAAVVVQAIPDLMLREQMALSTPQVGRALIYLASSIPIARTSPSTFNVSLRDRLARVAPQHQQVVAGIDALTDAFAVRSGESPYREPDAARWWRSDFGGAQMAWSGLLRWLGDWHLDQNETAVARSFYEAAIARSNELRAEWVDRKALLPLALIYSETDPQSEVRLNASVNQFTEIMFSGKAAAYQRGDLEQIREFHTALGAYYAGRGKWTGGGWQNAEYQLRQMRVATRSLSEQTKRPVTDPPELLERLGQFYVSSGKVTEAETLKRDVQRDFQRAGRQQVGANVVRKIDLPMVRPVVPDTVVKPTRRFTPEVQRKLPDRAVEVTRPPVLSDARITDTAKANPIREAPITKTPIDPATKTVTTIPATKTAATVTFRVVQVRVVDAATGQPARSVTVVPVIDGVARAALEGDAHRVSVPLRARAATVRVRAPGYAGVEQSLGSGDTLVVRLRRAP